MNESWQLPLTLGTTEMVVYEDNQLEYTAGGWYSGSSAATLSHGQGGRSTWRHNTWVNNHDALDFFPIFDAHGNQRVVNGTDPTAEPPGGDGGHRGTRQVERYANDFGNDGGTQSSARITDPCGGTVSIYDNAYQATADSVYLREEDGDSRFDYLQNHPGYDQHRVHIWNNLLDGTEISAWHTADPDDETFISEGTHLFFRAPEAGDLLERYPSLSYPPSLADLRVARPSGRIDRCSQHAFASGLRSVQHRRMIQLNPKTLQRIRDHLLDLGAPPSTHFLTAGADQDPFGGDPESQRRFEALFEAMFLMVVADGTVADEERDVLRGAMRTLTDNAIRTAHIEQLFEQCQGRLGDGVPVRLKDIATVLKGDKALADAAFSLAAAIAFADKKIADEENELINDLADALDLDADHAEELLNQLESD